MKPKLKNLLENSYFWIVYCITNAKVIRTIVHKNTVLVLGSLSLAVLVACGGGGSDNSVVDKKDNAEQPDTSNGNGSNGTDKTGNSAQPTNISGGSNSEGVRRYKAGEKPLVIAHRGARGYCPDHTRASYDLAINQGADYVEQDLYISNDGVPIVMHAWLTDSTDAKTLFPGREGYTYQVNFFSKDELKTMKSVMGNVDGVGGVAQCTEGKNPPSSLANPFDVLTLEETIDFVMEKSRNLKGDSKAIGLYIEFRSFSRKDIQTILNLLWSKGYGQDDKIFIQSWYINDLLTARDLEREKGILFPHILLGYSGKVNTPDNAIDANGGEMYFDTVKGFIEGVSLNFGAYGGAEKTVTQAFVKAAHDNGMLVHPWYLDGNVPLSGYLEMGIDGFFYDYPDVAVDAVNSYRRSRPSGPNGSRPQRVDAGNTYLRSRH